eukprot:jgi/Bigna1/64706/fgenesh1_kg.82_\
MLESLVKGTNDAPNKIMTDVKTVGHTSHHGGPKTYLRVAKHVRSHRIGALVTIVSMGATFAVGIPRMMWGTNKYD